MKNQALFSSKDYKTLKSRLLQFLFGALRVKMHHGQYKTQSDITNSTNVEIYVLIKYNS